MIILFKETGYEKVARIIREAQSNGFTVESIELPHRFYQEFIEEKKDILKIEKDSVNIGSIPNKVVFENIHIGLGQNISSPFVVYDNYIPAGLQPITEKVELCSVDDVEMIFQSTIQNIIDAGKVMEVIFATPNEYLLLRQAEYFEIEWEYLKLPNEEWQPKAGDRYHPTIKGCSVPIQIV